MECESHNSRAGQTNKRQGRQGWQGSKLLTLPLGAMHVQRTRQVQLCRVEAPLMQPEL